MFLCEVFDTIKIFILENDKLNVFIVIIEYFYTITNTIIDISVTLGFSFSKT